MTGFVLAGGQSRRMGRAKWSLVLGGETMLRRQVRLLTLVSRSVGVIGSPDITVDGDAAVFPDELPGLGPLGGIYTALKRSRTEFNLFASCDAPFLEPRFLRYLAKRAFETRADVTVPETPHRGYQPLCAVYRRRAIPAIRASLARGVNKVTQFYSRVDCCVLGWPELSRAGFGLRIFENMNTPQDYEAAKRRLASDAVRARSNGAT